MGETKPERHKREDLQLSGRLGVREGKWKVSVRTSERSERFKVTGE